MGFGFWIIVPLGFALAVGRVVSRFRSEKDADDATMTAFGIGVLLIIAAMVFFAAQNATQNYN